MFTQELLAGYAFIKVMLHCAKTFVLKTKNTVEKLFYCMFSAGPVLHGPTPRERTLPYSWNSLQVQGRARLVSSNDAFNS